MAPNRPPTVQALKVSGPGCIVVVRSPDSETKVWQVTSEVAWVPMPTTSAVYTMVPVAERKSSYELDQRILNPQGIDSYATAGDCRTLTGYLCLSGLFDEFKACAEIQRLKKR